MKVKTTIYNRLIEVIGFDENKLLIDAAREQEFFERRKSNFLKNYGLSLNKKYYLKKSIKDLKGEFQSDDFKVAGILNFAGGNDLVKWGFNKILDEPDTTIFEAKDELINFVSATDLLPSFGMLNERVIFLDGFYGFDFHNKKINGLDSIELVWIEAMYYILCGVAGAEYLRFLKSGEFENMQNEILSNKKIDTQLKKIKWLGNASHLGNIIYQLADKGYIEFPMYNGESNFTGMAERLLNGFEFNGKQPSRKYLSEQINPDSENNKIADTTKAKLKINISVLQDLS